VQCSSILCAAAHALYLPPARAASIDQFYALLVLRVLAVALLPVLPTTTTTPTITHYYYYYYYYYGASITIVVVDVGIAAAEWTDHCHA